MKNYRTNFPRNYGHPDIVLALNLGLDAQAKWLLSYFEDEIQRGVVFRPDETVQIGWTLVKLTTDAQGDLEIWEPRFDVMPVTWIRGANSTVRDLILQREVCAQVDIEPSFPSLRQSGIISPDFLGASGEFVMTRDESSGNDSGWLFREEAYQGSNGRHCSLFEIAVSHQKIIPFLALPAGATVVCSQDSIRITYGSTEISSVSNEFIGRALIR
ncbi:hypothetical protein LFL96_26850 [Paraburkholderia sp. D15]|uniref:immunity protein Imm33 domain-containing protein n=1 Tax=Paraburkholderia sp. D15 TaxID=2880218 RepID=UPI00247A7C4A|nr:hypothetical protein [Paraburkholderia sp. D15]WGS54629.1 hypothetical protein LFL96_26850 [Paraburkholderia sp. D15]